jgi:hypothetical protein
MSTMAKVFLKDAKQPIVVASLAVLLAPVERVLNVWSDIIRWGAAKAFILLHVPVALAVFTLSKVELISGDLVAFLARQPSSQQQVIQGFRHRTHTSYLTSDLSFRVSS